MKDLHFPKCRMSREQLINVSVAKILQNFTPAIIQGKTLCKRIIRALGKTSIQNVVENNEPHRFCTLWYLLYLRIDMMKYAQSRVMITYSTHIQLRYIRFM